jgi:hypothetical protein
LLPFVAKQSFAAIRNLFARFFKQAISKIGIAYTSLAIAAIYKCQKK